MITFNVFARLPESSRDLTTLIVAALWTADGIIVAALAGVPLTLSLLLALLVPVVWSLRPPVPDRHVSAVTRDPQSRR